MTPAQDPKQLFWIPGEVIWDAFWDPGGGGTLETKNGFGGKINKKTLSFCSAKVARATVWRRRNEPDPHEVPQIATKVDGGPRRASRRKAHGYPFLTARTPIDKLFGIFLKPKKTPKKVQRPQNTFLHHGALKGPYGPHMALLGPYWSPKERERERP